VHSTALVSRGVFCISAALQKSHAAISHRETPRALLSNLFNITGHLHSKDLGGSGGKRVHPLALEEVHSVQCTARHTDEELAWLQNWDAGLSHIQSGLITRVVLENCLHECSFD
jgi:hypothetical protein